MFTTERQKKVDQVGRGGEEQLRGVVRERVNHNQDIYNVRKNLSSIKILKNKNMHKISNY